MKTSALYLATAVVTAFYGVYEALWIIWGAPLNPLACVSLVGSAVFLVAAARRPWSEYSAAIIALVACSLVACLYVFTVTVGIIDPFSAWQEIRDMASYGKFAPLTGLIAGPFLIAGTAIHATLVLKHRRPLSRPLRSPILNV